MVKKLFGIPAYDGPTSRRIKMLVRANAKKGAAAIRFAQYRDGMTVQEYIQACDGLDVANYALFEVTWDSDPKRGFIALSD